MTFTVGTSGGNKDISAFYVGTPGGNKSLDQLWVGTSGGNKLIFASLSGQISPTSTVWDFNGTFYVSNSPLTATPIGGVAPFTYGWEVTGDAAPDDVTAATTYFNSATGAPQSARCIITDNAGTVAYTPYATLG